MQQADFILRQKIFINHTEVTDQNQRYLINIPEGIIHNNLNSNPFHRNPNDNQPRLTDTISIPNILPVIPSISPINSCELFFHTLNQCTQITPFK